MNASAPDTKASAASVKNTTPRSRVILASLVGTTIEFYDFYIYATAAVAVFPVLFFPSKDATTELLASFATLRRLHRTPPRFRNLRPLRRQDWP